MVRMRDKTYKSKALTTIVKVFIKGRGWDQPLEWGQVRLPIPNPVIFQKLATILY